MKKKYFEFDQTFFFALLIIFSFFNSCKRSEQINSNQRYPVLKLAPKIDDYFGRKIVDRYRILEDLNNKSVQEWLKKEKQFCDSTLQAIPNRINLQKEITDLMTSSNIRAGLPRSAGKKIFFLQENLKEGTQQIFYMDSVKAGKIELFNTKSFNKTNAVFNVDYYQPSYDGKYLAFGLSKNGDENTTLYVIDVNKKSILPDRIERTMGGNPNWIVGKAAFFYQQFKEVETEKDIATKYEDTKVKIHFIGTDTQKDREVFSRIHNPNLPIDKVDFSLLFTFPSSDKVLAAVNHGSQPYASLYFASLKDIIDHLDIGNVSWRKVCGFEEKVKSYALHKNELFLLSYSAEPNGRLEKRNLEKPEQREIIFNSGNKIFDDMMETQNYIYIKTQRNGINALTKIDLSDLKSSEVKLPFNGSIDIKPEWEVSPVYLHSEDIFLGLTSWNKEWGIYHYNTKKEELIQTNLRPQSIYGNPDDLIVCEVEVPSFDGTMVPLSIVYSKDIKLDGQNPTMLYAYGAYGISINSSFDPSLLAWFRRGGVYAIAHVRGGGEKGDAWYEGGYKATKPNSWKDFIACAQYLIAKKYTSPKKLAAGGGSAGTITIGRAITENPDLFKAAIISVGVPNTIRFEQSSNTVNIAEFGTTKDSLEFQYLYEMDTYHHIKKGVNYPSMLFTAGMNDARVDIWMPAKAVAFFQEVSKEKDNIILFKVSDNGHFGDNDVGKELADEFSFLLWQLGHPDYQKQY